MQVAQLRGISWAQTYFWCRRRDLYFGSQIWNLQLRNLEVVYLHYEEIAGQRMTQGHKNQKKNSAPNLYLNCRVFFIVSLRE